MTVADGKKRKIRVANIEGLLRLIQSVPPPKEEPFKRWLAKVAGNARKELNKKSGRRVSTHENYKELPESQRRIDRESDRTSRRHCHAAAK